MRILLALGLALDVMRQPASVRRLDGDASWYGHEYHGKIMANGKPFDETAMTCASWFWPLGTELVVTNPANGESIHVVCTDRGPAWRIVYKRNRIIDLSWGAFRTIADVTAGHVAVRVEPVKRVKTPIFGVQVWKPSAP